MKKGVLAFYCLVGLDWTCLILIVLHPFCLACKQSHIKPCNNTIISWEMKGQIWANDETSVWVNEPNLRTWRNSSLHRQPMRRMLTQAKIDHGRRIGFCKCAGFDTWLRISLRSQTHFAQPMEQYRAAASACAKPCAGQRSQIAVWMVLLCRWRSKCFWWLWHICPSSKWHSTTISKQSLASRNKMKWPELTWNNQHPVQCDPECPWVSYMFGQGLPSAFFCRSHRDLKARIEASNLATWNELKQRNPEAQQVESMLTRFGMPSLIYQLWWPWSEGSENAKNSKGLLAMSKAGLPSASHAADSRL
jgi:hypothetical protein